MIAYIRGKVDQLEPTFVVLDCQGIGYFIHISLHTYSVIQSKSEIKIFTHFQVREDAQMLYGFIDVHEKKLFELLISVSGIGGNTAMMILSGIGIDELQLAIQQEDINTLKRIKGIGSKTAGRIVLELKDKIKWDEIEKTVDLKANSGAGLDRRKKQEAITALVNLGLPKGAMEKKVNKIILERGKEISIEEIIKLALKSA